jgi:hypothetical protein
MARELFLRRREWNHPPVEVDNTLLTAGFSRVNFLSECFPLKAFVVLRNLPLFELSLIL